MLIELTLFCVNFITFPYQMSADKVHAILGVNLFIQSL